MYVTSPVTPVEKYGKENLSDFKKVEKAPVYLSEEGETKMVIITMPAFEEYMRIKKENYDTKNDPDWIVSNKDHDTKYQKAMVNLKANDTVSFEILAKKHQHV